MILIETIEQYQEFEALGYVPLDDWRRFEIEINLRVRIQRMLFGHRELTKADDLVRANERFYRWCFEHKIQVCEETGQPLGSYAAIYCSHIITRGSHPEIAHDPRNVNLLSPKSHERWESGKNKGMKIFTLNQLIIQILKQDYTRITQ